MRDSQIKALAIGIPALASLCRKWKVKRLALFGSVAELQ